MKKKKKSFLCWYYNLVDKQSETIIEITISFFYHQGHEECQLSIESNNEAFCRQIQIPIESVRKEQHEIALGASRFAEDGIDLDLSVQDYEMKGNVIFGESRSTRQSKWRSGIMGPYKYLPFLRSFHEVVSLSHTLSGTIEINGAKIDLTEGKGYFEQEWGRQYPKVWVWAQCNHFKNHDIAMMLGIARMPLIIDYYTSFAVPIYYKGQLEVFSNYNGGHIAKLYRYKGYIHLIITQKNKVMDVKIFGSNEVEMITARNSHMIRDVYQCHMAKMEIKIMQSNHIILEDVGYCCNLEMGGNTSKLK